MPAPPQESSVPRPGQPWWTQKTKPAQVPQPVVKDRCSPDEFYQAQLDWRSLQLQQVLDKRQAAEDAADAAANPRRSRAANGASPAAGPHSARAAWSEDGAGKTRASEPRPAAARMPEAGKRPMVRGPVTPGAEPGSVDRVVVEDPLDAGALALHEQHAFERLFDESTERRERRDATHAEAERLRAERESAGCTFAPRRAAPPPSSVSPRVAALAAQGAAALAGRVPVDYSESFYQAQLEWRRAQLQRAADTRHLGLLGRLPRIQAECMTG